MSRHSFIMFGIDQYLSLGQYGMFSPQRSAWRRTWQSRNSAVVQTCRPQRSPMTRCTLNVRRLPEGKVPSDSLRAQWNFSTLVHGRGFHLSRVTYFCWHIHAHTGGFYAGKSIFPPRQGAYFQLSGCVHTLKPIGIYTWRRKTVRALAQQVWTRAKRLYATPTGPAVCRDHRYQCRFDALAQACCDI